MKLPIVFSLVAVGLAACGGGGGSGIGTDTGTGPGTDSGPSFVNFRDSSNGEVVVDADNEEFRIDANSRLVVDRSGASLTGLTVDSSSNVFRNGVQIGIVGNATSTAGTTIAAFKCSDGSRLDLTVSVTSWSHQCASAAAPETNNGAPNGGTVGSGGFVTWNGSSNGDLVLDADNEGFRVSASTRQVVDRSGTQLNGITVDSAANVLVRGSAVGSVSSATATDGSTIAVFRCSNGATMDITVAVNAWTFSCGSSGTQSGGEVNTGASSRSFITWNGSSNGDAVLDATNEVFKFFGDSRCVFSQNTGLEYTNFCLGGPNSATVAFGGTTFTVTKVRSTDGSCIAGILTSDGFFADFVTSSSRIEFVNKSSVRPVPC